MNIFGKVFIVFFTTVLINHVSAQTSHNLANLFFRSRMASQDPAVTVACFNEYMMATSVVGEAYSSGYNQCLMTAKEGRDVVETEMANGRSLIVENSQDVCHSMTKCNEENTTLGIFNCHAQIGAMNTKAVYSISGNASEFANAMHEKYRLIDLKHEQCCKSAERKYVEDTAIVYHTLQTCLEGGAAPAITTTPAPSTTSEPSVFDQASQNIHKIADPVLKVLN
ncbi:uncharacterized protein LOC106082468 [Stomoxys calcitrans]|uniref:Protein TsetseEP domain-containing protein n=1 Tax=Stomoxys calcitrans TaxID=35570 RepID=A0A1I8P7T9_STOCA|nr:uncharacterized protein LOC106082468 [Stomoxys calcitrans]